MPRGLLGAGQGRRGGACPRRIARFLEPCLLLLLRVDPSHGYNLVEGLQQFGFQQGTLDASVVYRILRQMEQEGWLVSRWDTEGSGPPRRVYSLTVEGEDHLASWIEDLRCTRDEIGQFIDLFERPQPMAATNDVPVTGMDERPTGPNPDLR